MHEFRRAGREFGYADYSPSAGADVIVALDETCPLRRLGLLRCIVDRHLVRRPDLAAGNVRAPETGNGGQTFVGFDDGLAVRLLPGDDPPYFQRHGFPPE